MARKGSKMDWLIAKPDSQQPPVLPQASWFKNTGNEFIVIPIERRIRQADN